MNKRRREILAQLAPAVMHAETMAGEARKDVPGLAMHARVSAEAPVEIMIYGAIGGGGMFNDGISASDVAAVLREAGAGPVNVRINSPGGDVFQGVAIHSLLARHPGAVTMYVDGLAASAASFIMLAGDHIVAARNAMVMIHDGMTSSYGNSATLRRSADLLDKVSESIADMYAERAGEDVAHWRALMTQNGEDGTWYTGQEAMSIGLVDKITETPDEDEESLVWDRLATWNEAVKLPDAVADTVSAALAERETSEPDEAEDSEDVLPIPVKDHPEPGDLDAPAEAKPLAELAVSDDDDYAYRMGMWAMMNGLAARKAVAL